MTRHNLLLFYTKFRFSKSLSDYFLRTLLWGILLNRLLFLEIFFRSTNETFLLLFSLKKASWHFRIGRYLFCTCIRSENPFRSGIKRFALGLILNPQFFTSKNMSHSYTTYTTNVTGLISWLIDWLLVSIRINSKLWIDWLIEWLLFDGLIDWLIDWLMYSTPACGVVGFELYFSFWEFFYFLRMGLFSFSLSNFSLKLKNNLQFIWSRKKTLWNWLQDVFL